MEYDLSLTLEEVEMLGEEGSFPEQEGLKKLSQMQSLFPSQVKCRSILSFFMPI